MIKTEAERLDEQLARSKYFRKHYDVEAPDLWEFRCRQCDNIFAADFRWFKYESDDYGDFAVVHCPYCGRIARHAV